MAARSSREINDSRRAGRELAAAFNAGAQPAPVSVRLALRPGEICVGQTVVQIWQWLEGEGEYVKKSGGYYGGGLAGLVALRTASAIGNSRRKAAAGRAAAPQWRQVDDGGLYVTDRRFAIHGSSQWSDIWYEDIRMSESDSRSIILQMQGMPSTRLAVAYADYWFVMFHKLAYDNVLMPPAPDDESTPPGSTSDPAPRTRQE